MRDTLETVPYFLQQAAGLQEGWPVVVTVVKECGLSRVNTELSRTVLIDPRVYLRRNALRKVLP